MIIVISSVSVLAYHLLKRMGPRFKIVAIFSFSAFLIYITNTYFNSKKAIPHKIYQVCAQCNQSKLVRMHHCKSCKMCFFLMDHHCKLLGICISLNNLKGYLQSLVSLQIFSGTGLLALGLDISNKKKIGQEQIFLFSITLALSVMVGLLIQDQIIGLTINQTVLQSFSGQKYQAMTFSRQCERRFGKSVSEWVSPWPCYTGQTKLQQRLQADDLDSTR